MAYDKTLGVVIKPCGTPGALLSLFMHSLHRESSRPNGRSLRTIRMEVTSSQWPRSALWGAWLLALGPQQVSRGGYLSAVQLTPMSCTRHMLLVDSQAQNPLLG